MYNVHDQEYNRLLKLVLEHGRLKKNRTGINTLGVFGAQARYNLGSGFPLLTTKKVFYKGIFHELLWFLSGSTNIKYLVDNGVHIWDGNAYAKYEKSQLKGRYETGPQSREEYVEALKNLGSDTPFVQEAGDLGEGTYGGMWRAFPADDVHVRQSGDFMAHNHVDQVKKVVDKLRRDPDDRRMIVSAWHPYWVDNCALPPCHVLFHFNTEELTTEERRDYLYKSIPSEDYLSNTGAPWLFSKEEMDKRNIPTRRLNCLLYQRSCDLFLGVPFNIASYALLTHMMAHVTNMVPGDFIHDLGDLHIYSNHLDQVHEQLSRDSFNPPRIVLSPDVKEIDDFKYEDIKIENYASHSTIKGDMAV